MKAGDEVTIFADPLTEKVVEGRAILLKEVGTAGTLVKWEVRFSGPESDGKICRRFIRADQAVAS